MLTNPARKENNKPRIDTVAYGRLRSLHLVKNSLLEKNLFSSSQWKMNRGIWPESLPWTWKLSPGIDLESTCRRHAHSRGRLHHLASCVLDQDDAIKVVTLEAFPKQKAQGTRHKAPLASIDQLGKCIQHKSWREESRGRKKKKKR